MAVARKRDAKAEAGKLPGPARHAAGLAHGSGLFRAELPAARKAPAAWGEDGRSGNADLLASELVADAAEHADSSPGITCAATDTPLDLPGPGRPTRRRARPRHGDRHRPRHRQRRTSRARRQDRLVHPPPTASAVLPAVTGAPEPLSHPRHNSLANLIVSAGPAQALSGMRTPAKGPRRP